MFSKFGFLSAVCFSFIASLGTANASSAVLSACTILAGRVKPDISTQVTSSQRFSDLKRVIDQDKYGNFNTAQSSKISEGLSVVKIVDAFLHVKSNRETWQRNWSRFKGSTFKQAGSQFISELRTVYWSPRVIKEIISGCRHKSYYGLLSYVSPERKSFILSLYGPSSWRLEQILTGSSGKYVDCSGVGLKAGVVTTPIPERSHVDLICHKPAHVSLIISVVSDEGTAGPFIIKRAPTKAQVIVRLETRNADLEVKVVRLEGTNADFRKKVGHSVALANEALSKAESSLKTINANLRAAKLQAEGARTNFKDSRRCANHGARAGTAIDTAMRHAANASTDIALASQAVAQE